MRKAKRGKRKVFLRYQRNLALKSAKQRKAKRGRRAARQSNGISQVYVPRLSKKVKYFPCPEKINLSSSYEETIKFLMTFRQWSDKTHGTNFYVDLRPLKEISPAGALLLAAEFERWVSVHGKRVRAIDAAEWNSSVRKLLSDMGFFSLLSVSHNVGNEDATDEPKRSVRFLPFSSACNADGKHFVKLRDLIESMVGKLKARLALFQGVSEAIINVVHHAYPNSNVGNHKWWMSASIDFKSSIITVMVLDHGVGIPKTLPRKTLNERARRYLNVATLDGFSDDARMIDAAIALGRSATGAHHRGHGLHRDIQRFIRDLSGVGRLRIHSNRGCYKYMKSSRDDEEVNLRNFSASLGGTFVEWKFELSQLGLEFK